MHENGLGSNLSFVFLFHLWLYLLTLFSTQNLRSMFLNPITILIFDEFKSKLTKLILSVSDFIKFSYLKTT